MDMPNRRIQGHGSGIQRGANGAVRTYRAPGAVSPPPQLRSRLSTIGLARGPGRLERPSGEKSARCAHRRRLDRYPAFNQRRRFFTKGLSAAVNRVCREASAKALNIVCAYLPGVFSQLRASGRIVLSGSRPMFARLMRAFCRA